LTKFWHSGRGPQRPQQVKNFCNQNLCNSFKYLYSALTEHVAMVASCNYFPY